MFLCFAMAGRWTHETIVKFLEEYKKHKCLWDSSLPSYRIREYRHNAENDMVQALGLPDLNVYSLREKVRIIRNTYIKEVNKVNNSKKSATNPKNVYTPKLTWFSVADEFLRKCIQLKSAEVKSGTDEREDEDSADPNDASDPEQCGEPSPDSVPGISSVLSCRETKGNLKETREEDNVKVGSKRARRCDESVCRAIKALKTISRSCLLEENEFDVFGKSISAQLKQLPLQHALELQSKFQIMIVETRLSLISSRHCYPDANP